MIEKKDKRLLISNFISLSFLQGANYILPLLTFPYIVRILGIDNFGLLSFAVALIAYFNILTDYGFNLTATNKIAINKNNKDKLITIFSAIMSIKFILMCISFLILIALIIFFQKLNQNWEIFILTFGTVVGNMLFPIWLFQGLQKMKYITYINILSRVVFTIAIFLFVKNPDDMYIVPLFNSLGSIFSGIVAWIYIKKDFNITFKLQKIDVLKEYIIDGWHIFKTYIFVSIYTNTNILLLGFFTNNTVVGYYSIADKIIHIVAGLFTPINQTIYPYLSNLYVQNKIMFKKLYYKIIIVYIAISFILFLTLTILKNEIISFVNGSYNSEIGFIYDVLRLLLFTFPFGAYFAAIMNILQLKKELSVIILKATIINILLASLLIYQFKAFGLAITIVLVQYYIMFSYYFKIKENFAKNR